MITNIDENVGKLLARLKELGIERDTLVVFMNDNGGTAGCRVWNAGMRGTKGTASNGGTRGHVAVALAGHAEAGTGRGPDRASRPLPNLRRTRRGQGARDRGREVGRLQPRAAAGESPGQVARRPHAVHARGPLGRRASSR